MLLSFHISFFASCSRPCFHFGASNLFILSLSYVSLIIPFVNRTQIQKILQRFDEEGMLYLVPQGADDDWYWIYATVTEARENAAYVVKKCCLNFQNIMAYSIHYLSPNFIQNID